MEEEIERIKTHIKFLIEEQKKSHNYLNFLEERSKYTIDVEIEKEKNHIIKLIKSQK